MKHSWAQPFLSYLSAFQVLATCSAAADQARSTRTLHLQVFNLIIFFFFKPALRFSIKPGRKFHQCLCPCCHCVCVRLLLAEVRQPPVLPGPFACSLGCRFCDVQLRIWQAAAAPYQPCSPQHQRPEAAAVLDWAGALPHVPSGFPVPLLCGAQPLSLQWLLFMRRITLPKPEWCVRLQSSTKMLIYHHLLMSVLSFVAPPLDGIRSTFFLFSFLTLIFDQILERTYLFNVRAIFIISVFFFFVRVWGFTATLFCFSDLSSLIRDGTVMEEEERRDSSSGSSACAVGTTTQGFDSSTPKRGSMAARRSVCEQKNCMAYFTF